MRGIFLIVWILAVLFILSAATGMVYGAHGNFSPKELWTYKPKIDTTYDTHMMIQRDTIKTTLYYDVNNDGIPDVLVEIHNYTAKTYTLILLSGADGKVLYKNKFTDIASTHNGDFNAIEAGFYSITYVDSSGNVVEAYQYMIFQNSSDTNRVSIYKLNEDLSNASYTYIELPSTISTPYGNVNINMHKVQIQVMNFNYTNKIGLLFMGYYSGTYNGYNIVELHTIMLDYNLNIIWEKKEKSAYPSSRVDFYPLGVEPTDLNEWGFNEGNSQYHGSDVIMINETTGNTTIYAIEASNGQILWNVTLPGVLIINNPTGDLSYSLTFIDYNNDKRVDLEVTIYNENSNITYIYFLDSSGKILARYNAGKGMVMVTYSAPTYINFTTIMRSVDLNNDGYKDCVFITTNVSTKISTLTAFDIRNNNTIYQKTLENYSMYIPALSRDDINNDGTYELYIYSLNITTNSYWYKEDITALDGKTGAKLWNKTYNKVVGFDLATIYPVDVSDLDQDGFTNEVILQGYGIDSNGVYMNATVISLKNGSSLYTIKVHSNITDTNYRNWTSIVVFTGDINGDGINDVEFLMYHHTSHNFIPMDDTFIRFFDGMHGSLLWRGEVYEDHTLTQVTRMGWKSFGRNSALLEAASNNDILITTGYSVQAYEITGAIPEFSNLYIPLLIILAVAIIFYRWKK